MTKSAAQLDAEIAEGKTLIEAVLAHQKETR